MRLTDEQKQYRDQIAAYCADVLSTPAQRARLTRNGTTIANPDVLRDMGSRGLLGRSLPAAFGGAGATFTDECLFLEETSRAGLPVAHYSTALTAAQTYLRWADDEKKRLVVQALVDGSGESVTFTEPEAGSDLSAITTRAVLDGDAWRIDGLKHYISFASLAEHFLVLTRTDPSGGRHDGMTLLMVPAATPGVTITQIPTMGPHDIFEVRCDEVRVPFDAVVGERDQAWSHILRGLSVERVVIAAMSVGSAQRSLDDLLAWVTTRVQFGRTIGSMQAVRHRIADLATEIAHCRAFVYDLAARIDDGEEASLNREGSMAKLKATEVAKLAALEAMQLSGGHGYIVSGGIELQVRTALAPVIYGGSNEVQRDIIGKSLGL